MNKLTMKFCEWNLKHKGSQAVMEFQKEHHSDFFHIESLHCLANCTICSKGPFCMVNDFLFQEETAENLNHFLHDLVHTLEEELKKNVENKEGRDGS